MKTKSKNHKLKALEERDWRLKSFSRVAMFLQLQSIDVCRNIITEQRVKPSERSDYANIAAE
jgi:hypothetical protein